MFDDFNFIGYLLVQKLLSSNWFICSRGKSWLNMRFCVWIALVLLWLKVLQTGSWDLHLILRETFSNHPPSHGCLCNWLYMIYRWDFLSVGIRILSWFSCWYVVFHVDHYLLLLPSDIWWTQWKCCSNLHEGTFVESCLGCTSPWPRAGGVASSSTTSIGCWICEDRQGVSEQRCGNCSLP